jgi:hypothetical protein
MTGDRRDEQMDGIGTEVDRGTDTRSVAHPTAAGRRRSTVT